MIGDRPLVERVAGSLLGIPYRWGGEERDGCDCWGLCRLFAREACGPDFPDLRAEAPETHDGLAAFVRLEAAGDEWVEVSRGDVAAFDVVELDRGAGVAIAIDARRMLVTSATLGRSVMLPIWGVRWRGSLSGIYRWTRRESASA